MKHTVSRVPRQSGIELIQAICTLAVLSGIYIYSLGYSADHISLRDVPAKPAIFSSQYWNDHIGYGFTSIAGDTYIQQGSGTIDQVDIHAARSDGVIYDQNSVRVSFYPTLSIQEIEAKNTENRPRAYSRLPTGIAMIEGDLSSDRAKTVLATLHSR